MAVTNNRGYVKRKTVGLLALLMKPSVVLAERKFLSLALIASFSLLLLSYPSIVSAKNWQSLGRDTDQSGAVYEFFIDTDSVKRMKTYVEFAQKVVFNSEQTNSDGDHYTEVIDTILIDCARRVSASQSTYGYDRWGKKTFKRVNFSWAMFGFPDSFEPFSSGSFYDTILKRNCQ